MHSGKRSFAVLLLGVSTMTARSDEGMWLLNEPPTELLREKHGFHLTADFIDHARGASIRFNNGGSGSFLSADGLIVTNHHIGADSLQKLSTAERNLLRDGFYAKTRAEELKCPDLELNVLREIVDVTEAVNGSVTPKMSPAEAFAARRAAIAKIEKESAEKTGLRSDIVTLYQGGAYHLYRYKKYTDVRVVFAPEEAIAHFGGDVDNFEYPRWCLDICFFRAYENGTPAKTPEHFAFSTGGPKEGELVFVTGHPGTTNRLETVEKIRHRRDVTIPYTLARLRAMEAALIQFGERGPEERRLAATDLHRAANSRKAFAGQYSGLLDPAVFDAKVQAESVFQGVVNQIEMPDPVGKFIAARDRIAAIQKEYAKFEKEYSMLELGHAFTSDLFGHARHVVRMVEELPKPSAERLREYRDSNLESLRQQLYSPAKISKELEIAKLTASLTFFAEIIGRDTPVVRKVLGRMNPVQRATAAVEGTRLYDPEERRRIVNLGPAGIDVSNDPMIELAKAIDADARTFRSLFEEEVDEPERQAFGEIARLRFAALGKTVAPDATFTLRLAFGTVRGYTNDAREVLPSNTTFKGLFARNEKQENREPFDLPKRWRDGRAKLDPLVPFCFVSTADTIGGNSGSPVLNAAGEFVGINFDRNRPGLTRNFLYTDTQARHIAVHSKGILEALKKLYDCPELIAELVPGK